MKNRISAINRTIIALYAIVGAVVTILAAVALFSGMEIHAFGLTMSLAEGVWPRVGVVVTGLIMLAWSLKLIAVAFSHKSALDRSSVSLSNNENGDVRISIQAMDSLVRRAIGDLSGIASIKTNVLGNDDSISVEVSMALESDVHIPNATMLLQRTVKNFIEEYSGIAVRDVTVIVTSVADPIVVPKQLAIETMPRSAAKEAAPEAKAPVETKQEPQPEPEPEPEAKPEPEPEAEPEPEPEPEPAPEPEPEPEPEPDELVDEYTDYYSPYKAPSGNEHDVNDGHIV